MTSHNREPYGIVMGNRKAKITRKREKEKTEYSVTRSALRLKELYGQEHTFLKSAWLLLKGLHETEEGAYTL